MYIPPPPQKKIKNNNNNNNNKVCARTKQQYMITVGITIGRSNEVFELPNHMSLKSLKIKNKCPTYTE